ncbi:type II toxin-antitoxin system HipA family toxin [Stenotrophomonas sp.]|uniref:type II toxin-antitoxin system HipA family toxin n=1 Tax=Stenotrophomonas sp. TaxID=69392 RepID=UPI0028AC98AF|nr:type II toxin-antitoxin system HipA family toxin [Stenotrophomonas sp.]
MALNVLLSGHISGRLTQGVHGHPEFSYLAEWRRAARAFPLSLSLPLAGDVNSSDKVAAVLWGLLPDNESLLQRWASQFHVSARNPVGILSHVGEDCAGAVQFVRDERLNAILTGEDDLLEPLTDQQVGERLSRIGTGQAASRQPTDVGQFSLAGAQAKIALLRQEDGSWAIPSGRIPTTHILKPPNSDFDGFVENEVFCLRLARALGASAASAEMIVFGDQTAISVERYDRYCEEGKWKRVHQEDFCQALGVMPHIKYQSQGGPGPADLSRVLWEHSSQPTVDVEALLQALMFNYLIGGTDAHAKNYSMLIGAAGKVRLAPLYDVSSALPYQHIQKRKIKMAMKIGNHYRWWEIGLNDWLKTAESMKVDLGKATYMLYSMASLLPHIALRVLNELRAEGIEHEVLQRLFGEIRDSCERCLRQFELPAT